jgi:hypothetical protein
MKVQIINDKLGHFEYDIVSIEQHGYEVFRYANMTFGDFNWQQYKVYHDGEILQTVLNPEFLKPELIGDNNEQ